MPRVCSICNHSERAEIDAALIADTPLRDISGHYGVSKSALSRHQSDHLPSNLTKAKDAHEAAHADGLLVQVKDLQTRALSILDQAEAAGDLRTALSAIREARGNLELLAKLLGELQQEGTINITVNPEWVELRAVIVQALAPHPEAAQAVKGALDAR